jgi:nicotinamide mononucleotide transporter
LTYGYIAFKVGYYGDMMLNWFFFVPFQFIGFYVWKNRLKTNSKTDVQARRLSGKQWLIVIVGGAAVIIGFGLVLNSVDSWFTTAMKRNESIYTYLNQITGVPLFGPLFDSSTEVFQILAQLLMTWAFAEQWPLWMVNNVITILMWVIVAIADPSMLPMAVTTCVMWVAYLINSGYGWHVWRAEAAKGKMN